MITKIEVKENTPLSKIMFCKEINLAKLPDPRIVPLFGPNGAGKTTLLKALEKKCSREPFSAKESGLILEHTEQAMYLFAYRNSTDNFRNRESRSIMESYDPYFINARFDASSVSEGQSIIFSAIDLLDGLKPGKKSFKQEGTGMLVLLDELDSGMSIDNIDLCMRKIKYALSRSGDDLQIFLAFNSPRVLKHFPYVISLYDGEVHEMHTDEDMLREINAHKKMFDKTRKKSNGKPKVFS